MHKAFGPLVSALRGMAGGVNSLAPNHPQSMQMTHGWNQVGLTLGELAEFASALAEDIEQRSVDDLSDGDASMITALAAQLENFRATTIPQFWGGNGVYAIPAYIGTIEGVRLKLRHLMPMAMSYDNRVLPSSMVRRLNRISSEIDSLIVNRDELNNRMQLINEAYETAESLPEDLSSLREARDEVKHLFDSAKKETEGITENFLYAGELLNETKKIAQEAQKLVVQCEEAYRITTTKGLAGAFDQRASGLSRSMQLWVLALVFALCAAAYLGGQRVEVLSRNLAEADPRWGVIMLNFGLSLLSVGAPLWFAWISTKQISQRFRLAEDYGYKASVAKAYEGYRREAANLDPEFSARLFGSSLARLEEPPLRLVEDSTHGSPLHELLGSEKVRKAMEAVPEFKSRVYELLADAQKVVSRNGSGLKKAEKEE